MAEQGTGDELDLSVEAKSGSNKKLIIIIAVALLVLLGGGAAATLFLTSDDADSEVAAEAGSDAKAADEAGQQAALEPAVYHPMNPPFVVSLEGRPKTLQVSMQVMTRDKGLVEFLQHNDPLVRDKMLSLLMEQQGSKLKTRAGKQALQSKLKKEIDKIAKKENVKGQVEALYFTSFIMQ